MLAKAQDSGWFFIVTSLGPTPAMLQNCDIRASRSETDGPSIAFLIYIEVS